MPSPTRSDRARYAAFMILGLTTGWLACFFGTAISYYAVIEWIHANLSWALGWAAAFVPPTPFSGPGVHQFAIDNWFEWGPGGSFGSTWFPDEPAPANLSEFLAATSYFMNWGGELGWLTTGEGFLIAPVWLLVGLWYVAAVMIVRSLWDRRGPLRRNAARVGHMFYAGRFELRIGLLAGLGALPLFILWRFERALWESPIATGSFATETFQRNYRLFEAALLVQIAIIHWLIVWYAAKHALRYEARHAQTTPKPSGRNHCPWCGYEHTAPRCPECGNDPANPGKARMKISLGWIDRTPWLLWVFRTPTALAAIAFLFFSPIWLPYLRQLIAIL